MGPPYIPLPFSVSFQPVLVVVYTAHGLVSLIEIFSSPHSLCVAFLSHGNLCSVNMLTHV